MVSRAFLPDISPQRLPDCGKALLPRERLRGSQVTGDGRTTHDP